MDNHRFIFRSRSAASGISSFMRSFPSAQRLRRYPETEKTQSSGNSAPATSTLKKQSSAFSGGGQSLPED